MRGTPAWLWPNLLSLDAPIVALAWQDFAARTFDHPLRPAARVVLGLTVWAVYLADRLLDARAVGPGVNTARHDFFRRHPKELTLLLIAVLALDSFFALAELRREVFLHGLTVAACVAAYLLIFSRGASGWRKQCFAAVLFSVGVLLVSSTWLGATAVLAPGALFAGLCLSDLLVIETLERDSHLRLIALAPAAVAALAFFRPTAPWPNAVAASAILLVVLAAVAPRLSSDAMRVAADVVLLTPFFF